MVRIIILSALLFISFSSFGQDTDKDKNVLAAYQGKHAMRESKHYFSIDEKSNNLIVPSDNNGFKLYGIKIFDAEGNELISELIDPALNPNSIDISNLKDGEYIVHLVTIEQVLYRTKLVIKR